MKNQVWVITSSVADHRNCLYRNLFLLIDQPCHLMAEFGGTEHFGYGAVQRNSCCLALLKSDELNLNCALLILTAKSHMHERGIEPWSPAWQAGILPLNHTCSVQIVKRLKVGDGEEQRTLQVGLQIMQLNTNQAWNSRVSFHCGELLPKIKVSHWTTKGLPTVPAVLILVLD